MSAANRRASPSATPRRTSRRTVSYRMLIRRQYRASTTAGATRGAGRTDRLPRLWESEVDAARGGVGPAARHDFSAGVEVDALRPVDVAVTEQRLVPAAEGVVGDGNRDRHVDPHHAGLYVELELTGDAAVAGEDRRPVSVRIVVDQLQRLVVGADAHDPEHRPEDLVAIGVHLGRDVIHQRDA